MEYCSGCNYDHSPSDCSYGMSVEDYERESGDYRTEERYANGEH